MIDMATDRMTSQVIATAVADDGICLIEALKVASHAVGIELHFHLLDLVGLERSRSWRRKDSRWRLSSHRVTRCSRQLSTSRSSVIGIYSVAAPSSWTIRRRRGRRRAWPGGP
jgi:hypothetical protein